MSFKPINTEEVGQRVAAVLIPNLPDLSEIRKLELPETAKDVLIINSLKDMALKAEKVFPTLNNETANSPQVIEFISQGFLQILTNIINEAESLPPNFIAECGVNEAVFTNAFDPKPVAATDSLATCVGIAGYESTSHSGFLIHIATEVELEASKEMLTEKIIQVSSHLQNPIQVYLRGGIKGLSEPLVLAIEKWMNDITEKGYPMIISNKEVLQEGLFNSSGIPNTMSMSLDTRNGLLNSYDASTNPYAKRKIQLENNKEVADLVRQYFVWSIAKTPEIRVVYFPSQG